MDISGRSSSYEQLRAEDEMFQKICDRFGIEFKKNAKIYLTDDTYMQPDFYSAEHCIVGEIFAHIGKPKKAQDNKIANDILKMLLLEEVTGKQYQKLLVVCDQTEKSKLEGKSVLAESIRRFGVDVICVEISKALQEELLQAQERQKMTNAV